MGQIVQYGTITLTKFADADFTLSTAPADIKQIVKVDLDSDVDNVIFAITRPTAQKNTGAGTVLTYSTPGGDAKAEVNIYEDADRSVYNFLYQLGFPDSLLTGGKLEHFTQPGIDYTDYQNLVRFSFVPVDVAEVPDPTKEIVIERAMVIIEENNKMGQPNSMKVTFMGLGGVRKAVLNSTAALVPDIDLSAGATDKIVSMTMDGVTQDVNFGQSATTSQAAIISAIDAAFSTGSATINATDTNLIDLNSAVFGAPIILDDPATGTSGLLEVFGFSSREFVKGIAPRITK